MSPKAGEGWGRPNARGVFSPHRCVITRPRTQTWLLCLCELHGATLPPRKPEDEMPADMHATHQLTCSKEMLIPNQVPTKNHPL